MRYPIAIEQGADSQAFCIFVPDLPGCFSAGDMIDEAVDSANEAIDPWLETVIDDGGAVPSLKRIAEHQANPELAGWILAVVPMGLAAKVSGEAWSGLVAYRSLAA